MKFVSIPTTIEAEQVLDDDGVVQKIVNWVGSNASIYRDENEALLEIRIHEEGGNYYSARPGDWVIQFDDGVFGVGVAEEFWDNWEFPKAVKPEPDVEENKPTLPAPIPESEEQKKGRRQWAIEKVLAHTTVTTVDAALEEAKKLSRYLKDGDKNEDLHDQDALDMAYLVIAESVQVETTPEVEADPAAMETAKVEAAEVVINDLTKNGVRFKKGTVIQE